MCQDKACEVCTPLPAGGPNSTFFPSEACLDCVGGLEQDPDSGVCHQGLGGGLAGYEPPPACPLGFFQGPDGRCRRVSRGAGLAVWAAKDFLSFCPGAWHPVCERVTWTARGVRGRAGPARSLALRCRACPSLGPCLAPTSSPIAWPPPPAAVPPRLRHLPRPAVLRARQLSRPGLPLLHPAAVPQPARRLRAAVPAGQLLPVRHRHLQAGEGGAAGGGAVGQGATVAGAVPQLLAVAGIFCCLSFHEGTGCWSVGQQCHSRSRVAFHDAPALHAATRPYRPPRPPAAVPRRVLRLLLVPRKRRQLRQLADLHGMQYWRLLQRRRVPAGEGREGRDRREGDRKQLANWIDGKCLLVRQLAWGAGRGQGGVRARGTACVWGGGGWPRAGFGPCGRPGTGCAWHGRTQANV